MLAFFAGSPALYPPTASGWIGGQPKVRRLSIRCILSFDILLKNRNSNTTTGSDKVGLVPEHIFPVSGIYFIRKFLPNPAARNGLKATLQISVKTFEGSTETEDER